MKKLLFILFCLFALSSQAQTGHLKFMGIPLNGTINQFHAKIIAKGAKLYPEFNKLAKNEPCRYYTGVFAGNNAIIKIKYNNKTKIVWGSTVIIEYPSKQKADSQLEYYKEQILKKYPSAAGENVVKNGATSYRIIVCDKADCYGFIYLNTAILPEHSMEKGVLYINYKDYKNTEANERNDLEDL